MGNVDEATPSVRTLTIHTAITMVAAVLVTILVHEFSHAVASLMLGHRPTIYPFGVNTPGLSRDHAAIEALTGPAFSLVLGVILLLLIRPKRIGQGALLGIWIGMTSAMEGVGYLLLTPFGIGDTGSTALAYGLENIAGWPAFVIAIGGQFLLAYVYARRIARWLPARDNQRLRGVSFYPWIFGSIAVVALAAIWLLGSAWNVGIGDVIAVLFGALALGVWAPMAMPFTDKVPEAECDTVPIRVSGFPVLATVVAAVVIVVNVILMGGITVG